MNRVFSTGIDVSIRAKITISIVWIIYVCFLTLIRQFYLQMYVCMVFVAFYFYLFVMSKLKNCSNDFKNYLSNLKLRYHWVTKAVGRGTGDEGIRVEMLLHNMGSIKYNSKLTWNHLFRNKEIKNRSSAIWLENWGWTWGFECKLNFVFDP